MMFRLVRFLIIWLTLGRIKWLMRLTWVWRLVVFLGITGWLSKRLRRAVGLDKTKTNQMDSAWAEALRYTPAPAASASQVRSSDTAPEVSESLSEVTGIAADGSEETITLHEVSVEGETETIVRIADNVGNVETIVTGSSVEDIDLAQLGSREADQEFVEEIIETEIETESAVDEILDTLESAEPELESIEMAVVEVDEIDLEQPQVKRTPMVESAPATEPANNAALELIDPDWVRGDGTLECPDSHPVKAKASSMIYYIPESGHYGRTIADVCFASDLDAEAAGYRPPRR